MMVLFLPLFRERLGPIHLVVSEFVGVGNSYLDVVRGGIILLKLPYVPG
jgi:hypothetical protein